MTPLDAALAYRRTGLSVIPVPRPDDLHDGKKAAIPWKDYQTRLPTLDELEDWFAEPSNLAIVTGTVSGVVVVDADSDAAVAWVQKNLPPTPWQVQTAHGWHFYYRHPHPGIVVPNRTRLEHLAIDVRGDGGYVIAPPSVHRSGVVYEQAGDWSVSRDQLPRYVPPSPRQTAGVHPVARTTRSTSVGDDAQDRRSVGVLDNVQDAARRYLARIPRPEIGAGSDQATLYAASRLVKGFALSPAEAIDLLWEWAGNRDGWDRAWIARKVQNALRYSTAPLGALIPHQPVSGPRPDRDTGR